MEKPPDEPSISGTLKQKRKLLGLWSSKFCWIINKTFFYSEDNDRTNAKKIPITKDTEIFLEDDKRIPQFTIVCPDKKKLTFSSNLPEIFSWVFELRNCKKTEPKLTIEDFKIIQVLGRGFYGKVMLVEKLNTGVLYALKSIRKKKLNETAQVSTVLAERNLLSAIPDFPFILTLCFCFQTEHKFYLGLEYAPGGELLHFLSTLSVIPIEDTRLYIAEIALALNHLHTHGIIYRDLKPENVLLDKEGHIKLTDFGLSKHVGDGYTNTFCGTPEYLAPEIIKRGEYNFAVDWWALGCLLFEILFGTTPFYDEDQTILFENILTKEPKIPKVSTNTVRDLITNLLNKDPNQRFTFEQLKSHSFFNGLDWDKVLHKEVQPVNFQTVDENDPKNFSSEFLDEPPLDSEVVSINPTSWNIDGFSFDVNEEVVQIPAE